MQLLQCEDQLPSILSQVADKRVAPQVKQIDLRHLLEERNDFFVLRDHVLAQVEVRESLELVNLFTVLDVLNHVVGHIQRFQVDERVDAFEHTNVIV